MSVEILTVDDVTPFTHADYERLLARFLTVPQYEIFRVMEEDLTGRGGSSAQAREQFLAQFRMEPT